MWQAASGKVLLLDPGHFAVNGIQSQATVLAGAPVLTAFEYELLN